MNQKPPHHGPPPVANQPQHGSSPQHPIDRSIVLGHSPEGSLSAALADAAARELGLPEVLAQLKGPPRAGSPERPDSAAGVST